MCVTLITINDAANDLTSFPICGFSCFVNNYIKHFNSMESFQKIYTRYTLVNHHLPFYNLPYVKCYVTVSVSRFSYQLAGSSRRSRIFLRRRALSCEVPRRRDSVGGGSSRIFPWSPKADARSSGGGGVVGEFFRGLLKPARFSGRG